MTDLIDTDIEMSTPPIDYAARRADRARERGSFSRRRVLIFSLLGIASALLVAAGAEAAITAGRVHPGVTVSGVRVGGMTPENAESALRTGLPALAEKPVNVHHGDKRWEIAAEQVGVDFDYPGLVSRAMDVGRGGSALAILGDRFQAWTSGCDLPATARADEKLMASVLAEIAKTTDIKAVDARVKIAGTEAKVIDGKDGKRLDREKAKSMVLGAFTRRSERRVVAPVVVAAMSVDAAAAKRAAAVAERMLAEPVTVVHEEKSWEFGSQSIGRWIAFKTVGASPTAGPDVKAELEPYVSKKRAAQPISQALGAGVGRPAKNAQFRTSNGRVTIEPSQDGIGPDVASLALSLTEELKDEDADRVVELRTRRTTPTITTEKARGMGIRERISTYTTTYDGSNRPRVNNIHLLGDALDGTLIAPGGVFSFNESAGERTAAKGYQEANAIVNGKLVPQLGGGVCQVGTTVFNAVFESGLPVVQRHNHSFYISHYPKGRDATVSWGGPDLKFKNDTKKWVLVSVAYTSSSITISLYGTDPGYEVEAQTGQWTAEKPFKIEEVKDPKMPEGSRVIEDGGVTGRSITVKRIVSKGGKVVRTDTFVSNYKPKTQTVRVGTKKVAEESAAQKP